MAKKTISKDENPKERILDTASKLFYLQGYSNTGINQILEESKTFQTKLL
jgi:AcrR family transcriptional regulator